MKKYKVLVCDWDGTLFDSMYYKHRNAYLVLRNFDWADEKSILRIHEELTGLPRKVLFNQIAENLRGRPFTDHEFEIVSTNYTALNKASAVNAKLFPEVFSFLSKISGTVPIYVSSSAAKIEVEHAAENQGVRSFFCEMIGSEPGFSKGPEHLSYIGRKENVSLSDILFVGDDIHDVLLGNKADVMTFRIMRSVVIPDGLNKYPIIRQLTELEDYFV